MALSRVLGAGTHQVVVSAAASGSIPANPGEYVLQVFVNTFDSPGMTGLAGSRRFRVPPAERYSIPIRRFPVLGAEGASEAECEVLGRRLPSSSAARGGWTRGAGVAAADVCSWKGVRCDGDGVDRLLLDSGEGRGSRRPASTAFRTGAPLAASLSVLELDGDGGRCGAAGGVRRPSALEVFRFDPSGQLCVPGALRSWFDAIPSKSGDLPDCCVADSDADGHSVCDDNCPLDFNPDQANADGDAFGDACDLCQGDDDSGDDDDDGLCQDWDCDDSDGAGISCLLFRDGFESGNMSSWSSIML